jgi:hypothetical protein
MNPEWEQFKIRGDRGEVGSQLTTVRHVVHVPVARRIIEDGKIKAGLVYDESRLNTSRISVTWVSANTWGLGSIYGTVEFQFDWRALIAGQNIYWVEAMPYKPMAYRFLLTPREIGPGLVQRYDPTKDDGPLRQVGDQWYWNGNFTSEFMIDSDLDLDRATGLDFVVHHAQYCRQFGADCLDRNQQPQPPRTGGRILAYILGHELHVLDNHLKPTADEPADRLDLLDIAFSGLRAVLRPNARFGGVIANSASCKNVVRGALALYGMDQSETARNLLSLVASMNAFDEALTAIVRQHFAAAGWRPED